MLGVAALTITLAVMSGFESNLRARVLSLSPHVQVVKFGGMTDYRPLMAMADHVPGVAGADSFILGQGMLASSTGASGVIVRGIDPAIPSAVAELKHYVIGGSLAALTQPLPAGSTSLGAVVIGQSLARKLKVSVGQRVRIISPIVA